MNGRFKLVVTTHCVTQRSSGADDEKSLSKVDPPREEMATLSIPSLPSSDLNNMLKFVMSPTRAHNRVWPIRSPVEDEGERSPEPRTPRFGVNQSPSFAESNAQFGFSFETSVSKPDPKPEKASMQTTSTAFEKERILVSVNSPPSTSVNIPTTVMGDVDEPAKKSDAEEMPTILLSHGDGKPASFIRFLNDPIPLNTVNVEHEEVTEYKAVYQLVSDLDAIQRIEEEPSDSVQIISDQCVPGSAGVQYCEVISDDSSVPSQSELLEDVAAYQCVEDTPVYTELQTRISVPLTISDVLTNISDSEAISTSESDEPMTVSEYMTSNHQTLQPEINPNSEQMVEQLNQQITKDVVNALQTAPQETKMQILLKNELKHKIQLKRLQQGKGMLQVSFEDRPIGEPSKEEKEKALNRKMKNRESAVRSRKNRQARMDELDKEVKGLERENKKLVRDIQELKDKNLKLATFTCPCMKGDQHASDQAVLFSAPRSQLEEGRSQDTLSEAIANLLAAEGKT